MCLCYVFKKKNKYLGCLLENTGLKLLIHPGQLKNDKFILIIWPALNINYSRDWLNKILCR